jgi:type III secretion system FlhB-like substrate exporter
MSSAKSLVEALEGVDVLHKLPYSLFRGFVEWCALLEVKQENMFLEA